jgi:hypothetical protein
MHFEACGGGTFTVDAPVVVPPEPSLIPKPPELPPIPKPPPVSRELPVLQLGSKGEDVEYVQLLLFVDGIFGKVTEQAVKDFQKSEGLTVDGIVGPNTWKALLKEEVPPAVSVPHPEVKGRQMNITATVFGGAADPNDSAYTGEPLNDTDLYVALPYRLKGDRPKVRVFANGKTVEASIEDIGPWNVDDDYPSKNTRPVAETCYANKTPLPSGPNKGKVPRNDAGIDLSPETARRLSISGKDKVDWEFVGVTTT